MKIKVISFNIRCCNDKDGYSVAERAPRLAAVTKGYDADVIGLQEFTYLWEDHIERIYGDKYEMFNQYRHMTRLESPPILWKKDKFECLKKGCFWLSDTPEVMSGGWDTLGCNRNCEYVILRDKESGEEFVFMNTHLGFGDEFQIKSVELICDYAEKISSLPTFVTGDFNAHFQSPPYEAMAKRLVDVNGATVNDRRSTYHGYHPEDDKNVHIDYCFANEKVKPISFKIIDETVDGKFPSDHFGFFAELEI